MATRGGKARSRNKRWKLTLSDVAKIIESNAPVKVIAYEFGVDPSHISRLKRQYEIAILNAELISLAFGSGT